MTAHERFFSAVADRRAKQAAWAYRTASRLARYGDPAQQAPEAPVVSALSSASEFDVGDEVRVRGARGIVAKVGPLGLMVRGPRCPAGWVPAADVEEVA